MDFAVRDLWEVSDDFHARHSEHKKLYHYAFCSSEPTVSPLLKESAYPLRRDIDILKIIEAAKLFRGQHDFSAFRASDCTATSTVRTILRSEFYRDSEKYIFAVEGKGFLKADGQDNGRDFA